MLTLEFDETKYQGKAYTRGIFCGFEDKDLGAAKQMLMSVKGITVQYGGSALVLIFDEEADCAAIVRHVVLLLGQAGYFDEPFEHPATGSRWPLP